eukprot:TRINITY_DN17827_c1_g1_i20.p1 TRINITY_DN17827_c1_g1~~TRINITY_DN17827_c1_g1_i20.p1  ORF type:complete len:114 (+),score=30.67 TRINITY_DN17827_c1_g1_i20:280-621(+)
MLLSICVCVLSGFRPVAASTFWKIWAALPPFVVVARPTIDVCLVCQKNMHHIYRSANLSDEDKGELLPAHQAHLSRVDEETGELLPDETGELLPAHQAHLSRVDEDKCVRGDR